MSSTITPLTTTTPITGASFGALSTAPATTQVGAQANNPQMNQFLQLLTAQLQNQDPMQPTDPTQFVAQLAQFSTVEQLVQSNSTLTGISQGVSGLAMGQYSGLINHTVNATTTSLTMPASGSPAPMNFQVNTTGLTNVQVQITDSTGKIVSTVPVTGTAGTVPFTGLDSSGNALAAGQYGVALVGTGASGPVSAGTISSSGVVTAITQGSTAGTWQLLLNNGNTVNATGVSSVM